MTSFSYELVETRGQFSDFLSQRLREYNASVLSGYVEPTPCGYLVREHEDIIAGVFGWFRFGWFHLDLAWVHEKHRGRGLGSELLNKLESLVLTKGITRMRLETGSFQALPFYLKHGYEIFAENIIYGAHGEQHTEYLMRKTLSKPLFNSR